MSAEVAWMIPVKPDDTNKIPGELKTATEQFMPDARGITRGLVRQANALQNADGMQSLAVLPKENAVVPNTKNLLAGESYSASAEWEGTVTDVLADTFSATLIQIPRGARVTAETQSRARTAADVDQTELPIEDVLPGDRDLLKPGALFRLVVGYHISPTGRRRSLSVVFRRLPRWTESDLLKARQTAEEEQFIFDSIPRQTA